MNREQLRKVINNFKKVLPLAVAENHLDMHEGCVNVQHVCGTIHCHAGWYAIASCDTSKNIDFTDGIEKLSEDLGFLHGTKLRLWVSKNSHIWGNKNAIGMFITRDAFISDSRPEGAKTLQDIVDHWEEVYERLTE